MTTLMTAHSDGASFLALLLVFLSHADQKERKDWYLDEDGLLEPDSKQQTPYLSRANQLFISELCNIFTFPVSRTSTRDHPSPNPVDRRKNDSPAPSGTVRAYRQWSSNVDILT
ncbi:hypothetical protein V8E55_006708 [Tylopilus felleus]